MAKNKPPINNKDTPQVEAIIVDYIENYREHGDVMPSFAGLAVRLADAGHSVRREALQRWKADKEHRLSHILCRLFQKQEQALLNGGLSGEFNSTISKLILTKHGYSDKQELDHKSTDASMTPKEVNWTIQPVKPVNDVG